MEISQQVNVNKVTVHQELEVKCVAAGRIIQCSSFPINKIPPSRLGPEIERRELETTLLRTRTPNGSHHNLPTFSHFLQPSPPLTESQQNGIHHGHDQALARA